MKTRTQIIISIALIGIASGGVGIYALAGGADEADGAAAGGHNHAATGGGAGDELNPVQLSDEAARRIGVTYATAELRPFQRTVSTVGSVTYDETRLANVNPKIEGWIERLYVDFTGAPVTAGQPLLEIYSPMLVSAQEELILARRLADQVRGGGSERAYGSSEELLEAARRRLRYWDIPADEIARIEASGVPTRTVTLRSPASGIVVEKMAVQGSRIMPGMDIYRIADLSRVWVEGEVFEKDLSLVRLGQTARVSFEAYPGEEFGGTVTYVYPDVSLESRTGRIRVELQNPGLRLKPGMYAKLELTADRDGSSLMIPRSAVHETGTRSVVFLRHGDTLMPHEVTTGLVAGNHIEILAGIEAGMQVVSSANFLIDAESNMGSSIGSMPGMDSTAAAPTTPTASGDHSGH
jgi:Cu(I)/Ag(I) efflux system membrane fusion protein